jgi:ABC-type lipoprotein export system ATPase subunit
MKVSELYIKKYHQFEDFTLNLTYPEGHAKADKPLDKVCFIGQSGTGKTTLLEILKEFIEPIFSAWDYGIYNQKGSILNGLKDNYNEVYFNIYQNENSIGIKFFNMQLEISQSELYYPSFEIDTTTVERFHNVFPTFRCFNYPSEMDLPKKREEKSTIKSSDTIRLQEMRVIDFEDYDIIQIWNTINEAIIEDREIEIKKSLEISKILRNPKVSKDVLDKATDNFRKWREETPNPIQDLADNYLDKIIGRFNLKVKTELDFEKKEDIETIKIQQKNGKEIPFEALSTGTKQVILTALPLYGLKPKDSIILFDEPERSLYPDIQAEIVDFYTSMAENSQFFFATHSPLVAASFEPWEIVELKFNEETGNVEQELYYDQTKERHVDNYTIYPQYLTYDGILKRVFDMKKEPNSLRMNELVKLATLESQLKHNDLSPEAKKEKFEEIIKLADQLDWDLK